MLQITTSETVETAESMEASPTQDGTLASSSGRSDTFIERPLSVDADAVARSLLGLSSAYQVSQEALGSAPRPLQAIQAELLFFAGQYLFHHRDSTGESVYKLLSGSAIRAAFAGQPVDSGWLEPGIVRWGESLHGAYAVKWIPPGRHTIKVDKAALSVPLPGFVFMGMGESYFVWAAHGLSFSADALLYRAPLPNLYDDGRVCWGENRPPRCDGASMERAWELFITSPFNGDLVARKSKKFPNDIRGQLQKLSGAGRSKAAQYPLNDLERFDHNYRNLNVGAAVTGMLEWARGDVR